VSVPNLEYRDTPTWSSAVHPGFCGRRIGAKHPAKCAGFWRLNFSRVHLLTFFYTVVCIYFAESTLTLHRADTTPLQAGLSITAPPFAYYMFHICFADIASGVLVWLLIELMLLPQEHLNIIGQWAFIKEVCEWWWGERWMQGNMFAGQVRKYTFGL
jgi:hypothetical protein